MDVGIRELKARLSEFVERAAAGEIIRVTDRGNPKVIITAVPGSNRVRAGVEEGWIRAGNGDSPVPVRRVTAKRSIEAMLLEDRGE